MGRIDGKRAESAFTLVELLITIAIMGVVSIIALPAVSQLKNSNDKAEYRAYEKSFVYSGKQYNDAYSEDLFGNIKSGCVDVTYKKLKERNLIKNIQVENATCRGSNDDAEASKVRIRRAGDIYYYELFMECLKDEKEIYHTKNWNRRSEDCEINSTPTPVVPTPSVPTPVVPTPVTPTPEPVGDQKAPTMSMTMKFKGSVVNESTTYEITNKSDLTVTVVIEDSGSGLAKNNELTYTWKYKGSNISGFVNKAKTFNPDNNGMNKATVSLEVPGKVTDKDIDGTFTVTVAPSKIRDNNNNAMSVSATQSRSIKVDNIPSPPGVPSVPTVHLYKYSNNNSPSSCSGMSGYSNNTWYNGYVCTDATGGGKDVAYYQYTVTGASTNATNTKGSHRNIVAQKTSHIKYRACNSQDQCSKYSSNYTIKLDRGEPHCSISKSNTGTTSGVTLKVKCTDGNSGVIRCAGEDKGGGGEYTITKSPIKKSHEYNVKDEASNTNSCKVTVTDQRQKRTRKYDSCKTGSPRQCVAGKVKKTCKGYHGIGRYTYSNCRPATCSKTVACYDPCKYDCSYTDPCLTTKNTCKGGYSSWTGWSNVSSCSESKKEGHNQTDCRTIYK